MNSLTSDYRIEIQSGDFELASSAEFHILYVVDGICNVQDMAGTTVMGKSDVYCVNYNEKAHVEASDDVLVAVLSVNYYLVCGHMQMSSLRFHVNSSLDAGKKHLEIRKAMQGLLLAHFDTKKPEQYAELEKFFSVLHLLTENFIIKDNGGISGNRKDIRLMEVIRDIHLNPGASPSLNEIAEMLYMSPSAVSRLFQKNVGENYAAYIRHVRLEYVKRALTETDRAITAIAVESGFSTPSTLNKLFKAEYGITPSEYRKNHSCEIEKSSESIPHRDYLLQVLRADQKSKSDEQNTTCVIQESISHLAPWKRWENRLLNVGPAYALTGANMQKQILHLSQKLGVEYLRIWNPFSPKMMFWSGQGLFNFSLMDEVLDFCVDNRLKVFIDFAPRKDMAMASEMQEIYSSDAVVRFENESAWLEAMRCFLEHVRGRYREKIVGEWIFELTFFLNEKPYYVSEHYSNEAVWEQGYSLIKEMIPTARVAGPGLICNSDQETMADLAMPFLMNCLQPDIFTSVHFPYKAEDRNSASSIYQNPNHKVARHHFLEEQLDIVKNILAHHDFQGERWVTEWGNSIANRNYVQDSCYRGAFIVENTLRSHAQADALGIFYASDIINAYSDSRAVLSGSAGLLSRTGICKPSYYAYRFLSRLGRYHLFQNENCILTAETASDIRILCCNSKELGPKYYLSEENSHRPENLNQLFLNTDRLRMEITLNCEGQEEVYVVRQRILNEKNGSVLDKWIDFECASNLTRGDLDYLERVSTPEATMERIEAKDGEIALRFQMEPNEIRLIEITRV